MDYYTKKDIDNIVFDLLKQSNAFDVMPTPVDKIVDYAGLYIDKNAGLHSIPSNYLSKGIWSLKKLLRSVYGALDRERKIIYLEPTLYKPKKNFIKLHEVAHEIIPWQKDTLNFIDDETTLDPETSIEFEYEANYLASAALFQLDRFEEMAKGLPVDISSAMHLAKLFGGSIHASLRRYVESSKKRCALLVLDKLDSVTLTLKKYFTSKEFHKDFGFIEWPIKLGVEYVFVYDYLKGRKFNNSGIIFIMTEDGIKEFRYQFFNNNYTIFVFILPIGERNSSKTKIYVKGIY